MKSFLNKLLRLRQSGEFSQTRTQDLPPRYWKDAQEVRESWWQ